jgi:hypothetical protein
MIAPQPTRPPTPAPAPKSGPTADVLQYSLKPNPPQRLEIRDALADGHRAVVA